ncbi:hypothetical protein [Kocuria aegyptia]|uniref:Uncharacterized protein n=1 Tax=Kocuria aegyptia TaxID=330943 RepID=A0ABN2KE12_9MICC
MRVALVSGAAAVGWLVVGATGAHAVDGLPELPGPSAGVVAQTANGAAGKVHQAGRQVALTAAPPDVAAAAVAVERALPVEIAQSTLEPVIAPVKEAVVVEPVSDLVAQPVETVLTAIEPLTDVVEQTLPDDVVPVAPGPAAVVENVLPGAPAAEEILRPEPVTGPVVGAPTATPAASDASVAPPERPAAVVPDPVMAPELKPQVLTAGTPAAAAQQTESGAQSANPSSSDFLAGLGQPLAAPTDSAASAVATSPLYAESSPTATSVLPSPGATASAAGSGGTGTPLRSAGPDSWPEVPADLPYLELFPHLSAGQSDLFSGGVDQPPAPPAFDPGSTPD